MRTDEAADGLGWEKHERVEGPSDGRRVGPKVLVSGRTIKRVLAIGRGAAFSRSAAPSSNQIRAEDDGL